MGGLGGGQNFLYVWRMLRIDLDPGPQHLFSDTWTLPAMAGVSGPNSGYPRSAPAMGSCCFKAGMRSLQVWAENLLAEALDQNHAGQQTGANATYWPIRVPCPKVLNCCVGSLFCPINPSPLDPPPPRQLQPTFFERGGGFKKCSKNAPPPTPFSGLKITNLWGFFRF